MADRVISRDEGVPSTLMTPPCKRSAYTCWLTRSEARRLGQSEA